MPRLKLVSTSADIVRDEAECVKRLSRMRQATKSDAPALCLKPELDAALHETRQAGQYAAPTVYDKRVVQEIFRGDEKRRR